MNELDRRLLVQSILDRIMHPITGQAYVRDLEKLNKKYPSHPQHKVTVKRIAA